jgi:phage tail-like protein
MESDRRDFLKKVTGLTAAAVAGPALAERLTGERLDQTTAVAAARVSRTDAIAKFALELDGSFAGWLQSVEGGAAVGQVVTEKLGTDGTSRKLIAGIKYEDITINCGTGMSKGFYEWLQASFDPKRSPARRSGAIVAADVFLREQSRLSFANALVAELGLPALDASSREAAKLTVTLTPEVTQHEAGSGASMKYDVAPKGDKWLTSDFRLTIAGLDDATSRAWKIEAVTLRQKIIQYNVGQSRDSSNLPGGLEFSDLAVGVPVGRSRTFYDWHEDFVVKGNSGSSHERAGTLEYLDHNQAPLFTLSFQQLGVYRVAADKAEVAGGAVQQVKAQMYTERIDFKFSVGWA